MCGIFAALFDKGHTNMNGVFKLIARGPDDLRKFIDHNLPNYTLLLGFTRLAIMDTSSKGNQPMLLGDNLVLICNGEIYNYQQLAKQFGITMKSGSDCEIILHLYQIFGAKHVEEILKLLDGVFAFVLYDRDSKDIFVARDRFGVRPLFMTEDHRLFGSEMKALTAVMDDGDDRKIVPFKPGHYLQFQVNEAITLEQEQCYYNHDVLLTQHIETDVALTLMLSEIKRLFTDAVRKRMMSDRPIGCLLSGGLDSSLVCALVKQMMPSNQQLNTFSIGLSGSPDLEHAQLVANHLGTKHHHVELTAEEFLSAIPEVIEAIESWDITTVRASVGNYLIAKYIKEHTKIKVIFNGDGSDEMGGYLYFNQAPNADDYQQECIRLLKEIHLFDVLRSDRSISENGLEARTPFLDHHFIEYMMNMVPPTLRKNKYLLRKAFDDGGVLLPDKILWRKKEAFSDGVSDLANSWHTIIKNHVINTGVAGSEAEWYKSLFQRHYRGQEHVIPYYWMPRWCSDDIEDPSARVLKHY